MRHSKEANRWLIGNSDTSGGLLAGATQGPFHIALPTRHPDVTNHNILDTDGVGTLHIKRERIITASHRRQFHNEPPTLTSGRFTTTKHRALGINQLHSDLFARLRTAKDVRAPVALQDHMVSESGRKGYVGERDGGREGGHHGGHAG